MHSWINKSKRIGSKIQDPWREEQNIKKKNVLLWQDIHIHTNSNTALLTWWHELPALVKCIDPCPTWVDVREISCWRLLKYNIPWPKRVNDSKFPARPLTDKGRWLHRPMHASVGEGLLSPIGACGRWARAIDPWQTSVHDDHRPIWDAVDGALPLPACFDRSIDAVLQGSTKA